MVNVFPQSRLRPSSYNIVVASDDGGQYGIAQGIQGYMDVVDAKTGRWLREGMTGPSPPREMLRGLTRRGYLTLLSPQQEQDFVVRTINRAVEQKSKSHGFTIILSYDCNFRCTYCIQREIQNRGEAFEQGMSDEVMDSAFRFMESTGDQMRLTLYGGEPFTLANRHRAVRFLSWVKQKKQKIGCVTNGYEWEHFWDVLDPQVISYLQVTIDGLPEYHNRRRVIRGKGGTFAKILENVVEAVDRGLLISLRVNADRNNIDSLRDLEDLMDEKGLTEKRNFNLYIANVTPNGIMSESKLFGKQEMFETIAKNCGSCASDGCTTMSKVLPLGMLNKTQRALETGGKTSQTITGCSAYTGLYVIDPFGKLYACWDAVGMDEEVIGAYHPQVGFREAGLARWRNRHERTLIDKCLECPYVFHHGSGCQKHAYQKTGDWNERDCDDYPWLFDAVLKDRTNAWTGNSTITSRFDGEGGRINETA